MRWVGKCARFDLYKTATMIKTDPQIQILKGHFISQKCSNETFNHNIWWRPHTFGHIVSFWLNPFKEWSMNGAIIVTKIITSLHTIFCHIKSECSHYHWAPGLMLQPPIAKWSLSRLYKWEKIICLEAAVHFSPIIQLISEVVHGTRRANRLMIHMWNDTPLNKRATLRCMQVSDSNLFYNGEFGVLAWTPLCGYSQIRI